ncbi:MAG: LCP family protein [Lancefieldella parvula]|uniref:LCP family protein n=1 Tax=Lancefieldella parvula TaxID=1382 RepID=A0A9D5X2M6_9ACTN|nr:LCP family protein [Lancefieldella parvula]
MSTKPKHAKLLDNSASQDASADAAQNTAAGGSAQGTAPNAVAHTSQNAAGQGAAGQGAAGQGTAAGTSPFSRTQAEGYHKRRKRVFRKQVVVRSLLGVLATVFVAALVGAGIWYANVQAQLNNSQVITAELRQTLQEPSAPSDPYYVLLLGTDGRPGETEYRADSIILARVDPIHKRVTMLSIPRDTRVLWKGSYMKINAVHFYDGANGMVQAVNELCGVHIAHYAEVNFDGLAGITDALGGVTVNVEQYMRDTENFSDVVELYPGVQKLNGAQALFFTRVRYAFADSDYTRMRHQRTFIKAMIAQILNTGDPVAIANIVNSTARMVITDLSVSDIISLGTQMIGMNTDKDIYTAYVPSEGTEIDGQSYVIADKDALAKMMKVIEAGDDPSSLNGQTDAEANAEAAEKSSEESSESSNSSSRQ